MISHDMASSTFEIAGYKTVQSLGIVRGLSLIHI